MRVEPGGNRYSIYVLDDTNENYLVKKVFDGYPRPALLQFDLMFRSKKRCLLTPLKFLLLFITRLLVKSRYKKAGNTVLQISILNIFIGQLIIINGYSINIF